MWKKILPIAGALLVAWIVLNMLTSSNTPEPDAEVAESTGNDGDASSEETTDETVATDEIAAADDASDSEDEASAEVTDAEVSATDAAAVIAPVASVTTSAMSGNTEAEAETETETEIPEADSTGDDATDNAQDDAEDAATSEPETTEATETTDTTETAESAESAETTETTETTEASTDDSATAEASASVQMRYPVDPETGLTLYDQGMIEVPVEPETEEPAAETATDDAEGSEAQAEPPADVEDSATQEAESSETATEVEMGMRYLTDPVTGATIYEGGMVEMPIETSVDTANAAETDVTETGESLSEETAAVSTEGRLPVDPVTGATVFESTDVEDADAEVVTSDTSNRIAFDPVTGATIFPTEDGNSETDGDTATSTTSVELRQPTDISGISRKIGGVFGATSAALSRASDAATAKEALPKLEAASESLGQLAEQFQTLPDSTASMLGSLVQKNMAKLTPQVDITLARSGVGPVLSPVIQPMMEQLQSLAE